MTLLYQLGTQLVDTCITAVSALTFLGNLSNRSQIASQYHQQSAFAELSTTEASGK